MMQLELLSPAKNLEVGRAAINYGADAVYIGASKFGARSAVGNSIGDIAALCNYAHKYGAKVYAAVNTILYDSELASAQKLIEELYEFGADAIIFQDMAVLKMDLPPIPLFASTQTNNYSLERIKFLESAGVSRIILARELGLDQIKEIRKNTSIELESFVHGALCVSMSGNCYFSHATTGRSANRGECSQPCRHQFTLTDAKGKVLAENKHLLSLKDLNLSTHLRELAEAGISSFKIEGRLKDINYVKNITSYYRKKLDEIIEGSPDYTRPSIGSTKIKFVPDPERSFNRGFSDYFLRGRHNNLLSNNSPKSLGKPIGRLLVSTRDYYEVDLFEPLVNGDGICYFDNSNILQGFLVNNVFGNKVYPNEMRVAPICAMLYRNHDKAFEDELFSDKSIRKIKVDMKFNEIESGFEIICTDEQGIESKLAVETEKVIAQNPEAARQTIIACMSKTGNTIFDARNVEINCSNMLHFSLSILNDSRRKALDILEFNRTKAHHHEKRIVPAESTGYYFEKIDYSHNVVNKLAKEFYSERGVEEIEPGFELQKDFSGKVIMTTKHCLAYEFGLCEKYSKKQTQHIDYPLYLLDNSREYELEFNCSKCMMNVVYPKKK